MSMAATTGCEPGSCGPFSGSVTTGDPGDLRRGAAYGDLLLQVPVRPADRYHITALLQRHQVHDVGYFGPGTFEQFAIPDTG